MDEIDPGVEPAEQAVRTVEEGKRFLIAPHALVQQRELAGGLRLAQHGPSGRREIHGRAEPRFGERGPAGLAIHGADHPIGVRLGAPGAEPVEQRQGRFRILSRILEALARHVHLGTVHQTQALQVRVAGALGQHAALPKVGVGRREHAAVHAQHAEIMVRDGAPVLVAAVAVRRERSLVARDGLLQVPLNVREDAEVLVHSRIQVPARPAELERPHKRVPRLDGRSGGEMQAPQRVQGFGGESIVADRPRHVVAAVTQLACLRRLVSLLAQDREAAQRLRQDGQFPAALCGGDRGLVADHRLSEAAATLLFTRVLQQLGSTSRTGAGWTGELGRLRVTRRRHRSRSVVADP